MKAVVKQTAESAKRVVTEEFIYIWFEKKLKDTVLVMSLASVL